MPNLLKIVQSFETTNYESAVAFVRLQEDFGFNTSNDVNNKVANDRNRSRDGNTTVADRSVNAQRGIRFKGSL